MLYFLFIEKCHTPLDLLQLCGKTLEKLWQEQSSLPTPMPELISLQKKVVFMLCQIEYLSIQTIIIIRNSLLTIKDANQTIIR
jgi:hypothetical protein